MSTVGDRIREARKELGLSAAEAGQRAGVTRVSWERYELNKSEPKPGPLKMLVKGGISADWLLAGEGPMLRADSQAARSAPAESAAPAPTRRPTADRGAVATVSARDSREVAIHPDFVAIPRYDVEAAAGSGGAFVDQEVGTGYYAFGRLWLRRRGLIVGKLSVISVTGDSMEPDLREGDLVLIDHAQTRPRDGLIYNGIKPYVTLSPSYRPCLVGMASKAY